MQLEWPEATTLAEIIRQNTYPLLRFTEAARTLYESTGEIDNSATYHGPVLGLRADSHGYTPDLVFCLFAEASGAPLDSSGWRRTFDEEDTEGRDDSGTALLHYATANFL